MTVSGSVVDVEEAALAFRSHSGSFDDALSEAEAVGVDEDEDAVEVDDICFSWSTSQESVPQRSESVFP